MEEWNDEKGRFGRPFQRTLCYLFLGLFFAAAEGSYQTSNSLHPIPLLDEFVKSLSICHSCEACPRPDRGAGVQTSSPPRIKYGVNSGGEPS